MAHPEKLRASLDRGQGAKTSHPDPSTAPLGTDEEAAGTPVSQSAVDDAIIQETRRGPQPSREGSEPNFWPGAAWIIALAGLVGIGLFVVLR